MITNDAELQAMRDRVASVLSEGPPYGIAADPAKNSLGQLADLASRLR